tara:strand:- start:187 stop:720 length:534 start_codon:yes stop_codon:yes gene_type:complete
MALKLITRSDIHYFLKELCIPKESCDFVWDINLDALRDQGYEVLFVDLDSTLASHDQRFLSLKHLNWIQTCKDYGFKVVILSNNRSRRRVKRVLEQIQCDGMYMACKPFTFGIHYLAKIYNLDLSKSVVIGDQVFKDVVVGNWLKLYTILVKPLDRKISFLFRMQKDLEYFILKTFA